MKNLKRSLKYLAVFNEPLSDDNVPRTLSSGDGVESEDLESLRKRRDKENGTGRGKTRPGGLRRNRNPLDCPFGGPDKGKGMGRGRQAPNPAHQTLPQSRDNNAREIQMKATALTNSVSVKSWHVLPDGVQVVEVECHDAKEFLKLPAGIVYSNRNFGKTGWNSDHNVCYYRTDKSFAFSA
ncbi:MAG TPA: hypothetical protein VMX17_15670 [Candidatus Glassbacteria bacterium]|nr:hypothetical protein [Candidatus Glassbacteria bacterium]